MAVARSQLIDLDVTRYYHCFNRCVRQEFLFGKNEQGRDFSHRKAMLVALLKTLTDAFGIQLSAYAVMSNHYHTVLHVDKELVLSWSDAEVIARWRSVARTKESPPAEKLALWRARLYDISWFMRFLNERMARICNKEDNKKGRFWDNRFKSQPLIDEGALLACMAYVDLNAVRAGQAATLEDSDFTSIQEHLKAYKEKQTSSPELMAFQEPVKAEAEPNNVKPSSPTKLKMHLPFALPDYIRLVDWTGRQIREGKGYITKSILADNILPIVKRAELEPGEWMNMVTSYNAPYKNVMGTFASLCQWAQKHKKAWLKGQKVVRQYYLTTA